MAPEGGGDEFAGKGGILYRLHDTRPFFFVVIEEHGAAGFEFRVVVVDVCFYVIVFMTGIDEDEVYGLVSKEGGGGSGVHDMEFYFVLDSEGGDVVKEGFLVTTDDFCHRGTSFTWFEECPSKIVNAVQGGTGGEDRGYCNAAAPLEGSKFDDGGVGRQLFDHALEGDSFRKGKEAGDFFPEQDSSEVVVKAFKVNLERLGGLHGEWAENGEDHGLKLYQPWSF